MPLELGTVRGFKTRFHLYTVPGQVFYDASRKLILKGVDGVVFVADSQEERMDANVESLIQSGREPANTRLRFDEAPLCTPTKQARSSPTLFRLMSLPQSCGAKRNPLSKQLRPVGQESLIP